MKSALTGPIPGLAANSEPGPAPPTLTAGVPGENGGMHPGTFIRESCHPVQKQKLNRRKMVWSWGKVCLRRVLRIVSLMLNLQGVLSLHSASNATVFNLQFFLSSGFLSAVASDPTPIFVNGKKENKLRVH